MVGNPHYTTSTACSTCIQTAASHSCPLIIFRLAVGSIEGILEEGVEYSVGGKAIELDRQITRADYNTGRCFGNGLGDSTLTQDTSNSSTTARKNHIFVSPSVCKPPVSVIEKRGIPLMPVNLASNTPIPPSNEMRKSSERSNPTYWTANW